ncbi:MAG: BLUF domain-containing protein [Bacteroidota bacterium]
MLYRLIYHSTAKPGLGYQQLKQILLSAEKHNLVNEITGVLLYSEGQFLQILEGSRENLTHTFLRISQDFRHSEAVLVDFVEIGARDFPAWGMKLIKWPEYKPASYMGPKFEKFRPQHWTGLETHNAIMELVKKHKLAVKA